KLSVDRGLDCSVHANNLIGVPLTFSLAPVFDRLASGSSRIIRNRVDPTDTEHFSVDIGNRVSDAVAFIQFDPFQIKHLHFDTTGQPVFPGDCITPNENTGITSRFHMLPLNVEYKVLVLLLRTDHSDRFTLA